MFCAIYHSPYILQLCALSVNNHSLTALLKITRRVYFNSHAIFKIQYLVYHRLKHLKFTSVFEQTMYLLAYLFSYLLAYLLNQFNDLLQSISLACHLLNHFNRSIDRTINRPIKWSINQSINQPTNQLTDQSINQSITHFTHTLDQKRIQSWMRPPVIFPAFENWSWMNLPNRLELLLYTVLALPNASMIGLIDGVNKQIEHRYQ